DRRLSFGEHGRHEDVGCTCDRCFVQENVSALQRAGVNMKEVIVRVEAELGAEFLEAQEVGVESPASDLIAARLRNVRFAKAREDRTQQHYRSSEGSRLVAVFVRFQVTRVDIAGGESV